MLVLRSAAFQAAFWLWSAVMNLAWLPVLLLPPRATVFGQTLWAKGVMVLLRWIAGTRFEVRGRANLPASAVIVAAKHQSAWDTIIFHIVTDDPAIVIKRELLHIPVYGWYCRKTGMIPIDRAAGPRALRSMLRAAERAAAAARPIVIFPQGTRVAPDRAAPYLPGAAALYGHLGLPVVPVALNSGLFWPRRSLVRRPGLIVIEFLPAIAAGLERRTFAARLEEAIESASRRLAAEGRAGDAALQ
ncbi:MAG: 1-acyl-sn-glycerol-3-phosphate acyltransferase [Alphaproteobacteria bacterium]|nr:1-acyl-sn-glycerol-3-phosphate acyltransferase [Alphaproteobacteria bacterium]